jgi:hypothetical protein
MPVPTSRSQATPPPQATKPAPALPGEGSLWLLPCRAFRAHRAHHRRDPKTGAWRCAICQPEAQR